MRKLVLLLTIVISSSFVFPSFAQIQWGVKAGGNLATIASKVYTDNPMIGFNLGLFSKTALSKKSFILTEAQFSLKGGTTNALFYEEYLNIPVLAGLSVNKRLAVLLGLEGGYLIKAGYSHAIFDYTATDEFKRFDIGLEAGLRYQLTNRWGVDLRYIFGLVGIDKPRRDTTGNFVPVKSTENPHNHVLQIGLYYSFSRL